MKPLPDLAPLDRSLPPPVRTARGDVESLGGQALRRNDVGPRLCFLGPMLGRYPGYVTSQCMILSDLFQEAGYSVVRASSYRNRGLRLADFVGTLVRHRRQIDVVAASVFGGLSFVAEDIFSWMAQKLGLPIVMFLHGGAMPEFMARYPRWTKRVLRRADVLLCPSNFLARAVEEHGFQARIVPNVVNIAIYPFRLRRRLQPRLFWMRTFHPHYNPEMAIRVLARVRESAPSATLVMAGQEKGLGEETRRLANRLGVADAVDFVGFLDLAGKTRAGDSADIFLNTNRVDNMPVSVVEACAMGLPVVATQIGGIGDLLTHGQTGLLVPDDDDQAMAEAVLTLLADEWLAERLSAQGRALAEQSAWSNVRQLWENVFHDLQSRSRP